MSGVQSKKSIPTRLTLLSIGRFWWPLAASWMLMGSEMPAVSATIARLPNPEFNLASFGVVFAFSLIIEAPIIMLLAASTALARDWASYAKMRRFMMRLSAALTLIHIIIAFTPIFDLLMLHVINLPAELLESTRIGLRIMTPWTWAIGYRRFNQGVLIRLGHTRSVGLGTVVRLLTDVSVLAAGLITGMFAGVVVATSTVTAGVLAEALYIGLRVRPILRNELKNAPIVSPPLQFNQMLRFYVPLALTSFIALTINPIGSAALSRAPLPIESLAVWPVMNGIIFLISAMGVAYLEVVVALMNKPGARLALRRFTIVLTIAAAVPMAALAFTPLSQIWFNRVAGLSPELAQLARSALPLALLLPIARPWINWFQGMLVYEQRTRIVTESIALNVLTTAAVLFAGIAWGRAAGVYVGWTAFSTGAVAQVVWLWLRSRVIIKNQLAPSPVS